jgi:hypothetical protein
MLAQRPSKRGENERHILEQHQLCHTQNNEHIALLVAASGNAMVPDWVGEEPLPFPERSALRDRVVLPSFEMAFSDFFLSFFGLVGWNKWPVAAAVTKCQ